MQDRLIKIISCTLVSFCFLFSFDDTHLRFFVTSDVKGETEPCGWKKKPAGGLARKCTVINNSKDAGFETIVLDAGNLFFKQDKVDPGISLDVAKENAYTIVRSFNHITCDAFSPGVKDFAAGLEFLKKLRVDSNFDYISCNIKDKNKELLFEPYKIIQSGSFSVGVIGASSVFESKGVYVENPFDAIKNISETLNSKCDFVVLLFSCSDLDYKKLSTSSASLGVDFIIRGNTRRKSSDGGKGTVPIYSTGDRGKIIYQFDLKSKDEVSPLIDIAFYEKSITTDKKRMSRLSDTPENSDRISDYRKNIELSNLIVERAQNTLQFKMITLNKMVSDDPYVLKIVDAGKAKILDIGGPSFLDPHHGHNH